MNEIDYTGIKLDKIYCTKVIPEKCEHLRYLVESSTILYYFLPVVNEWYTPNFDKKS